MASISQRLQLHRGHWTRRAAAVLVALLMAACGGGGDAPPPPTEGSATIGADGGMVDGPDGVKLIVPAGAVDAPITFRIARDATGAPELVGLNALTPIYAVTPHGQAFGADALFSIPLAGVQVPAGATPVLMKAEPGGTWRVMRNASADPTRLAADLDGLSFFTLGICSSTPNDIWTIGAIDCPANHELKIALLDDAGQDIDLTRTGPNGRLVPQWFVTDTEQTRFFSVRWTRPAGTNRTDQIAVVGLPNGFNSTGFRSTWGSPAVVDVNGNFSRTFSVTIDPARVSGASNGVNGTLLRVKASASYSASVLRVGQGVTTVGFDFENAIPIAVKFNGALPAVNQQPANVGVTEGQPVSFTVAASGGTLSYQWSRRPDATASFADIGGATAASYAIAATQLSDNGAQFQVQVCSAPTRCITSNPATLTVTQAPVVPGFLAQPADMAVVAGQTASFSVTATGTPLPQLRWQSAAPGSSTFGDVAGVAACGTTNPPGSGTSVTATCTVGPLAVGDSGQRYRVVASNAASPGGVISNVATLTVAATPVAPAITQRPAAQSTSVGGSASFSITATGTAPLNYTWGTLNGGVLPSMNGNFTIGSCSGQITYSNGGATITLSNLTIFCSGLTVTVMVSNGVNPSATSNGATLTVTPVTQGLSLVAGDIGGPGTVDGTGAQARVVMSASYGIAFDAAGNAYFNDGFAGRVRKVTPTGVVSTISGAGTEFRGNDGGIAVDSGGNIYFPERSVGNRILRMTPQGAVSVWLGAADGWGNRIVSVAMDVAGNLYGAEGFTGQPQRIVKITPARVVSTYYSFADVNGSAVALAADASGNLYASGGGSLYGALVRMTPAGVLSTVAGAAGEQGSVDGTGAAARFAGIGGLVIGTDGFLYATDGRSVRRIRLPDGEVTTVSGFPDTASPRDGFGTAARYESPGSIAAAPNGDLMIGDGSTLRRLSTTDFAATTLVGKVLSTGNSDGSGAASRFSGAAGVVLDTAGNAYVADVGNGIRKVTPSGVVTTLPTTIRPRLLARDVNGDLVAAGSNAIWRVTLSGVATLLAGNPAESNYVDAPVGTDARFGQILGLAVDGAGNVLVSESINQNSTIRRITPAGAVSTWAGVPGDFGAGDGDTDGDRLSARFRGPKGLAFDSSGNLFVADSGNFAIRRIAPAGDVTTVAGTAQAFGSTDGSGAAARFRELETLAFDNSGNLLISDFGTLRRMTPAGAVTTVMGLPSLLGVKLGSQPQLNRIGGLAVRPNGRVVLTSEAAVLEATLP